MAAILSNPTVIAVSRDNVSVTDRPLSLRTDSNSTIPRLLDEKNMSTVYTYQSLPTPQSEGRASPPKPLPALPTEVLTPGLEDHIEIGLEERDDDNMPRGNPHLQRTSTMPQYPTPEPHAIPRRSIGGPTRPKRPEDESKESLLKLVEDLRDLLDESRAETAELQTHNAQLLAEWRLASANLAQSKASTSHTIEDAHFVSEWLELRYSIKNWAVGHFGGALPKSTILKRQNPHAHVTGLSEHWKAYLKDGERRPLLVQAYLWHFLQLYVFGWGGSSVGQSKFPRGCCWAGVNQGGLAELNANIRPPIENIRKIPQYHASFAQKTKEYFAWRISTITYLEHCSGGLNTNSNISPLIRKIHDVLSPFCSTYPEQSAFGQELQGILAKAIAIDADMWKQKAFFHPAKPSPLIYGSDGSHRFNPETMDLWESIDESALDPNPELTLVIAPCLIKSGNSDGEGYEFFSTKAKALVSCESSFLNQDPMMSPSARSRGGESPVQPSPQQTAQRDIAKASAAYVMSPKRSGSVRGKGAQPPSGGQQGKFSATLKSQGGHGGRRSSDVGRPPHRGAAKRMIGWVD